MTYNSASKMSPVRIAIAGVVLGLTGPITAASLADDAATSPTAESTPAAERPAQKAIRELALQNEVRIADGSDDALRSAELHPEPLMTYGDETRAIGESALWVWIDRDQPVLFEKIEVNNWNRARQWTFCFSSFGESPLSLRHAPEVGHQLAQTNAVTFAPVPGEPQPGKSSVAWPLQARELSRKMLVESFVGKKRSELRLFPKPLLEFRSSETGVQYGGVFGFATGTNPDVLVQLRLRLDAQGDPEWVYAVAPMTSGRVVVSFDGQPIAEPAIQQAGEVSTWGYFFSQRSGAIP